MTESEWLASNDPAPMLRQHRARISERKRWLYASACGRTIWDLLSPEGGRAVVRILEDHADGMVGLEALQEEYRTDIMIQPIDLSYRDLERDVIRDLVWEPISAGLTIALSAAELEEEEGTFQDFFDKYFELERKQAQIIRDIFGNPFRPLPPRPEAIAPLAERIYAGEWDKMPLLGQWLQEHGYPTEAEHCLDPNIHHVKGCWVVDWATGRE
jgi:hypothetical protein